MMLLISFFSIDQVRRIMALRINNLARGRSGVSLQTFNTLVSLFNSGCTPEVPCQGTVGASGKLLVLCFNFWSQAVYEINFYECGRRFGPSCTHCTCCDGRRIDLGMYVQIVVNFSLEIFTITIHRTTLSYL